MGVVNINIYDITLDHNIGIEGNTNLIEIKNNYTKKRTTAGRSRSSSSSISIRVDIDVQKMDEDSYRRLAATWRKDNTVIITTERGEEPMGLITNPELNLDTIETNDGDIFYFGSLTFEE